VIWPGGDLTPITVFPCCSLKITTLMDRDPSIELLTRDDLANMLKISRASVYRLVERRQIPFFKVGGSIRFAKNDVLTFLRKGRIDAIST
jgi:excisionase family DNA binding protein